MFACLPMATAKYYMETKHDRVHCYHSLMYLQGLRSHTSKQRYPDLYFTPTESSLYPGRRQPQVSVHLIHWTPIHLGGVSGSRCHEKTGEEGCAEVQRKEVQNVQENKKAPT